MRAKCSPKSRLRETAQQLTVAAGLRGKNEHSRGLIMRSSMFNRSRRILNSLIIVTAGGHVTSLSRRV